MTRVRATQLVGLLVTLILLGWGIGTLVVHTLSTDDLDAVKDLAADRVAPATVIAHVFSWIGSGFVVFPVALVCCLALYRRGHWTAALAVALSTAGAQVIVGLDKVLVGRPRPPLRHLDRVTGHSFPSGHTAQTAALCTVLLIEALAPRAPRRLVYLATLGAAVLVACVGFSRIYLAVHYPSDVVAGAVVGIGWSLVASRSAHGSADRRVTRLPGRSLDWRARDDRPDGQTAAVARVLRPPSRPAARLDRR